MRTWEDFRNHVKGIDEYSWMETENIECMAAIIGAIIEQRNTLGISQRELAARCEIPQSTLARIESFATTPNLETLLKIMQPLGLRLSVTAINAVI